MVDLHRHDASPQPQAPLTTLEVIPPQPKLRIRIEHSRTIKDGWSYSTTVEMDGIDATSWRLMQEGASIVEGMLMEVRRIGELERDTRNQRDTAAKEATAQISSNAN